MKPKPHIPSLQSYNQSYIQKVSSFDNVDKFILSELYDFQIDEEIKGVGIIHDITTTQVRIENTWFAKKALIPIEKLSARRIKTILQKPISDVTAQEIRYLRQIEKQVFKPSSLRSDALNEVMQKLTGSSLRDDPHLANSICHTIEYYYENRIKKLTKDYQIIQKQLQRHKSLLKTKEISHNIDLEK